MKTFGWIYIIAYCVDALVGLVASFVPQMETLSNIISSPVSLLSIVVLILACIGKLTPRKIFLAMSGLYMFMIGFGIVLGVLLVAKLGPSIASQEMTLAFFREQFTWYGPVHWAFMVVWLLMAAYGVQAYRTAKWPTEQSPGGDSLKAAPQE